MNKFEHFIITVFNVRRPIKNNTKILESDWLSYRFELFDRFCYPSVRAQTNQKFKWLVYFDPQTPKKFKDKVHEYSKWHNFIPIYSEIWDIQLNRKIILNNLSDNVEYLITTNLDNDDAIAKDFVNNIHQEFKYQKFEFISFPSGHILDINNKGKLYSFKYLNNPFVSLIEKINSPGVDGFKTINFGVCHTDFSTVGKIKSIQSKASWLQVVHGNNASNCVRGIRQPKKNIISEFPINYAGLTHITDEFSINYEDLTQPDHILLFCLDWIKSFMRASPRLLLISLIDPVLLRLIRLKLQRTIGVRI
jgi:hypothetical protein